MSGRVVVAAAGLQYKFATMRSFKMKRARVAAVVGLGAFALATGMTACEGDDTLSVNPLDGGGTEGSTVADASGDAATAIASVTQTGSFTAPSLTAPVDMVRDEWGNPHIYGSNVADIGYVQGYVTAQDRLIQLEFERHFAAGRIAELAGSLSAAAIQTDIGMRMHHMEADGKAEWATLQAATDPESKAAASLLTAYAKGVNAYVADVIAGKFKAPSAGLEGVIYNPAAAKPWAESDSLMLGQLESYDLAYDSDAEITSTMIDFQVNKVYGLDTLRKNLNKDLQLLAPQDPTTTINGWTGADGTRASGGHVGSAQTDAQFLQLLKADRKVVTGMGDDHNLFPERGSNNWIIGPALSKTGNVLVANDTHLGLTNPSTFYIVHLHATDPNFPMDVMGESFPGIPGVILGMTQHTAWGATVSNIDVTDVYADAITSCDGSSPTADGGITGTPCTTFKGNKVPLTPRVEAFGVGSGGKISKTINITLYDDPNHGPVIPRPLATNDGIEPLGAQELSVKYTGYTPSQLVRFVFGLDRAASMKDMLAALDADFDYGGQNWVIGDDQGNFGWSEYIKVPRRASATLQPWKVLPGDGTDEWVGYLDPKYIPHSYNPTAGFLATANADPIGVSLTGDPFLSQPTGPDGLPLYIGWDYDPGTRVGRITKRIQAATAGGAKLGLDDLQSIQADATTEWGQAMGPTLLSSAQALQAEITTPGTHPDIATFALGVSTQVKAVLPTLITLMQGWTYDTPSGAAETAPTAAQIADSKAALIYHSWYANFQADAIGDELAALDISMSETFALKLMARACTAPTSLAEGTLGGVPGADPILFDDVTTGGTVETKLFIASKAITEAITQLSARLGHDPTTWTWGAVHTLTLDFVSATLGPSIPASGDKTYPNGFPRHGAPGTVDVGGSNASTTNFGYTSGPAIRFVCELTKTGPVARNVLPGGAVYDPTTPSPHYADQMELWRKNQTYDLAYQDADVIATAIKELAKNGDGRIVFSP
jgi:penicillin amidase